ncbi:MULTISPECIES: hypothetical protein [Legionella]|uniref:Dot/Icm T4SS effector n=1 Tax=Legionella resiliens TaxID=2905958 RepID=A0ABS8X7V5_9GAMM|nr:MULTISPECIES: hypothetical protein [unclassified Legionella]MCE0724415.1 hypothetical protein [Legionella sp. 9fVS26]MCE3533567.1 hypothetical protein [Legionella sp. 8cVS16]QLZ69756.1 hypothetical protein FOLKNPGA_02554 [Legionella sp. PC1000]
MPKVRGPKDGKIVTASFDPANKKDNSKSRFPSLKTTKDLVLLSIVGNEFCAGEYLGAIVQQAVATHQTPVDYSGPKGKTTFLIADEIYWHNLKDKTPIPAEEMSLKRRALDEGEAYFEKNLAAFLGPLGMNIDEFKSKFPHASTDEKISIINQLALEQGKNFEIVRWNTWVTQRDFDKTLKEILPYYDEVNGLRVAIDNSVTDFVKRHAKQDEDRGVWIERSRGYLKEESPSIMLLAAQLGYNFVIYPGAILPPFEATREYFIVDNHVARIERGKNIEDPCTHNKFCLHTANPSRLVNWLEVNFTRSHKPAKTEEVTKQGTTKQEVEAPKQETTKERGVITFFSPSKTVIVPSRKVPENQKTEIISVEDDGVVLQFVPKKESIISSIVQGISHALENQPSSQKGRLEKRLQTTPLTQIFEGITQGVLATDLPAQDKIDFLAELVETYVKRMDPKDTPSRMPMIS